MSNFEANQTVHGFRVVSSRKNDELSGNTILMCHEKTGARLFWLDNGAENMVFSIAFRTIPRDNTGVFHILEHSVLCGSRKYPVKEPFVELLKSSMSTFLNAMTFPDMTMYPVASRNPRDLMNLTRVYLDAVFYPAALEDSKCFRQEGWHIDRDEDGNYEFRGVVYNEMKGAMSEVDAQIDHRLLRELFPDTGYGFNSGGDPESIPDLTWNTFCERYRETYHPSNAYIYLDGRVPIDEMLAVLDEYLSAFEKRDDLPVFACQVPRSSETSMVYELSAEEDIRDKGHLTVARVVGMWSDRSENVARGVISDVLTGSNDAPLKHAALEQGLCQNLTVSVDDTGYQSWIEVHADNVTDGMESRIMALLEDSGRQIQRDGLNREAVEASMNRLIYNIREEDEPQGIGRCIRCMSTWLYGGEPEEALETQDLIRELKGMLQSGRMDELAADMLLNREARVILHSRPSHTAGEEKRAAEQERLRHITEAWTEAERTGNEESIKALEAWQQIPDSQEALRSLPMLTREDAVTSPVWTETEETTVDGVPVMTHRLFCNGIVYLRAYFTMTDFSLEELLRASMIAGMMGRLATDRHDALTLQQEIKRWTGGLAAAVTIGIKDGQTEACTPMLVVYTSSLEEYADQARDLMLEVLTGTYLTGQEDRIREMMIQNDLVTRQRLAGTGHLLAVKSVLSQYSAEGAARNALDGEPAVRYVHRFATNPDAEMADLISVGTKLLKTGICRRRMTVGVTGLSAYDPVPLIQGIPEGNAVPETAAYTVTAPPDIGYCIPSQTGFMARGYHLSRCGIAFQAPMLLVCSILTLEYLWNRVRVLGGAYGAGIQVDRTGNIFSYSFRDPTPGKTLMADGGAAEYIREFVRTSQNLDRYIISCLNELNPLLSPRELGALADARKMNGYTKEIEEKSRLDILNATGEDLIRCAGWLERFAKEGNVCLAASREILEGSGNLEIREI